MREIQKITPILWFDDQAEDAINFYCSIFKNSRIESILHHGQGVPQEIMIASFQLEGQQFTALCGLNFKFSEAISFAVACDTQEEVDELWERLSERGERGRGGWIKDKFGILWQVVPAVLSQLLRDPDPRRSGRVAEVMSKMTKIDIAELWQAYERASSTENCAAH